MERSSGSVLALVGERGSGKTSILANWLRDFQERYCGKVKVVSHFVGSSAHSTDVVALMKRCTEELREEYADYGGTKYYQSMYKNGSSSQGLCNVQLIHKWQ